MTDLTLIDAIESAMFRVRERIAAAIVAGDDPVANRFIGELIREEVNARLADWRELERPSEVSDDTLAECFRDVYAAQADVERRANAAWTMALGQVSAEAIFTSREKLREQWAEMTAEVRAHEAGE